MTINRIKRLTQLFDEMNIDAYLVTSYENRAYMSGFGGSNCTLLISGDMLELYTDFRYDERAREEALNYHINIVNQFDSTMDIILKMCNQAGIKRLGFESDCVTVEWLAKTTAGLQGVELAPCPGVIGRLRRVKDAEEIEKIATAQNITDEAFTRILGFIKPGVTESEIAAELQYFIAQRGCKLSFDTIVASGPNGSKPHAVPGERKVQKGDFVTMDFGAMYDGYCSDMTRTIAIGNPSDRMRQVYGIVLEAQLMALDAIKTGVVCKDIDALARQHIEKNGFGDNFGHGLGHSLGLEIHEEPRFSPSCEDLAESGNCMSVEPGIYLNGEFGVRIEDIVCVTEQGCINYTSSDKQLIIL